MKRTWRAFAWVGLFLSLGLQLGCSWFRKKSDALPSDAAHGRASSSAALSTEADRASSLQRASSQTTYLRLKSAFPGARDGVDINPAQFSRRQATGTFRTFADGSRPSSALVQISLEGVTTPLCQKFASTPEAESTPGGIFYLTPGEAPSGATTPQAKALNWSLAAARNIWLGAYESSDAEVLSLAKMVSTLLTSTDLEIKSTEAEAKIALCRVVFQAPQFLLGNPGRKEEGLRRAALELLRIVPKQSDLRMAKADPKYAVQYFKDRRFNADGFPAAGYLDSLATWHEDWLGLRPFGGINRSVYEAGSSSLGTIFLDKIYPIDGFSGTGLGLPMVHEVRRSSVGFAANSEHCEPKLQAFDPRTTSIFWMHRNPLRNGRFEVAAAVVHAADLERYRQHLLEYFHETTVPAVGDPELTREGGAWCSPVTTPSTYRDIGAAFPGYSEILALRDSPFYECRGRVMLANGAENYEKTDLTDIQLSDSVASSGPGALFEYTDALSPCVYCAPSVPRTVIPNKLRNTVARFYRGNFADSYVDYPQQDRVIFRYSPSGLQNGYSELQLPLSGEKILGCNSISKIISSCAYRTPGIDLNQVGSTGVKFVHMPDWYFMSMASNGDFSRGFVPWNAKQTVGLNGYYTQVDSFAHPIVLNLFACGVPNASEISKFGKPEFNEYAAYPRVRSGWDPASRTIPDSARAVPSASLLNPYPSWVKDFGVGYSNYGFGGPEADAIQALNDDLVNEPKRLLGWAARKGGSYRDYYTADFSLGSANLESYYRSQGYILPTPPPAAKRAPVSVRDPLSAGSSVFMFHFGDMPAIPSALLASEGGNFLGDHAIFLLPPQRLPYNESRGEGMLKPKAGSGVLTMPAFISPVAFGQGGTMRTLASRYFERFLCGGPSNIQPKDRALHTRYIPFSNPQVAAHLKDASCVACHINLDPLASALAANFPEYVQRDTQLQFLGEMSPMAGKAGIRGGSVVGMGAFLDHQVSGVREVAQVLTSAPEFHRCAAQRAFENVIGRSPVPRELDAFNAIATQFGNDFDYNAMIERLVSSNAFLGVE